MAWDFKREMEQTRRVIEELREQFKRTAEELRQLMDFGSRAADFGRRLENLPAEFVPPPPTPPQTEIAIEVMDDIGFLPPRWQWRQPPSSRFGRIVNRVVTVTRSPRDYLPRVVRRRVRKTVLLDDPRLPGSPARDITVRVRVTRAQLRRKASPFAPPRGGGGAFARPGAPPPPTPMPPPPPAEDLAHVTVQAAQAPPAMVKSIAIGEEWEYVLVEVEGTLTQHLAAIKADDPPTPAQKVYLDRKHELETEVQNLQMFIADIGGRVGELKTQTDALKAGVDRLQEQAAKMPQVPDAVAELVRVREQIEALRDTLPDRAREVEGFFPQLDELKKQAKAICPELPL